ncbi:MAG: ABC transporter permease subunit [Desulfobacteraceae bacterium]|nr:ABC transporter permease subunit [Desulfobacteraceae bacterium]
MDDIVAGIVKAFELLFSGDESTWTAVLATVKVSTCSMLLSIGAGLPCGFLLGYYEFRGKQHLRTVLDTMLALPTVFIGLVVFAFISNQGPLGDFKLLFSLTGIAIGQTILAFPIVTAITATTIEAVDPLFKLTLVSLGAGKRNIIATCLWEVRYGILAGAVTAYGRVLTEVGISMMVGGNIKWHTRTVTTAIALETGKGEFANGIALGIILITLAFAVNLSLSLLRRQ